MSPAAWWSWQHAEAVPAWWNAISAHLWPVGVDGVNPIPDPQSPVTLTLDQRVSRLEILAMIAGWRI